MAPQLALNTIKPGQHIDSLDVMRGFSMFWLIGGAAMVGEFAKHHGHGGLDGLADQMNHASWVGLKFIDLIFPLFIFASGATIPPSITRLKARNTHSLRIATKALQRTLTLIAIGILYRAPRIIGIHRQSNDITNAALEAAHGTQTHSHLI